MSVGTVPKRLGILAAVFLLIGLGLRTIFNVSAIQVAAPSHAEAIQSRAKTATGVGLWQNNLLTLSTDTLERTIQQDPRVQTATVTRQWPSSLKVAVTLRHPAVGWISGNQAYVLDQEGSVIAKYTNEKELPVVTDGSNVPVTIGQRVASKRFIDFVLAISKGLPGLGVPVTQLTVKDTTLDLYGQTGKGFALIMDTSRAPQDELADLQTILSNLKAQGKVPQQYIDIRISGKAYYR